MTKGEKERLKYLDLVLNELKNLGGTSVDYAELLDTVEGNKGNKIISKLVAGGDEMIRKALTHLTEEGYIFQEDPQYKGDNYKFTLTYDGEMIVAQGGLLNNKEAEENQIQARTRFHSWSPWIAIIAVIISLASLALACHNYLSMK